MNPLPLHYDPKEAEERWQRYWFENGTYHWRDDLPREETFVIDTPPPTVSGLLHMGHIFSYTQADFIARYQRMRGKDVFYPMGFDDNGLPTERLVEKTLKKRAVDLGREQFIVECDKIAEEARIEFRRLFESTALSVDWRQEYHTISDQSRTISQLSFLDLYHKGKAYRQLQPMFWDPVDQTAIAQAEIEDKELPSHWNEIIFRIQDSGVRSQEKPESRTLTPETSIIIGTTRPELIPACVAIFYHPDDTRYQHLRGKHAITPLFGVRVPILEDDSVEMDKGTGIMMCCTFGDEADILKWRKHNLPTRVVLNKFGKMELNEAPWLRHEEHSLSPGERVRVRGPFNFIVTAKEVTERARELRKNCTEAEKLLWYFLRGRQLAGYKFRRQHPIASYVADFYCEEAKLVIELDGGQHGEPKQQAHDKMRTAFLEKEGYTVLRFWNNEVFENLEGVWQVIFDTLQTLAPHEISTPHPNPLPKGEGSERDAFAGDFGNACATPEGQGKELLLQLQGLRAHHPDPKVPNARAKIIELLKESGDLVKSEPITHAVPCAERSGAPLEILPSHQWFIKILDQKDALKKRVDECQWHPHYMSIRAHQWIDGLSWDWCISRQRYFGVPFPVWFSKRAGEEGKILVAEPEQLPVNPLVDTPKGYSREEVEPEADVMDTWATSSVSPQLNSHGINRYGLGQEARQAGRASHERAEAPRHGEDSSPSRAQTNRHAKLFPADLRPQAHEIIRTWAFYTLVKAHLHENTIPWENLMISGWCLAEDKTKMSKSKGNVVTPVDLIEEQGADAVRYWASTSRLGADTAFSKDVLKIGRKLVTKLWNASKFASIQLEKLSPPNLSPQKEFPPSPLGGEGRGEGYPTTAANDVETGLITETLDKWILTRLHRAIAKATEQFENYEYAGAREAVEDFFWNDFCDNYLEMVKKRAYGKDSGFRLQDSETSDPRIPNPDPSQHSAILTIHHCLEAVLRLFAPFVPHITEELYSHIFAEKHAVVGSIHARGNWPKAEHYPVDSKAEEAGIASVAILNVVRKSKAEAGVSLKWPVEELIIGEGENAPAEHELMSCFPDLQAVANAKHIDWGQSAERIVTEDGRWHVAVQLAEEAEESKEVKAG